MSSHTFHFFRAGGVDQVQLRTGADLLALQSLDQKLWVALSCPVEGLEFDERTLSLIDSDGDGRVQAPELLAAIRWAGECLGDVEELAKPGQPLPLKAINADTDDGKLLLRTATSLLKSLGKADAQSIGVDDVTEALETFNKQPENGDGVLPPDVIVDEALKKIAESILGGMNEERLDRSGAKGIDRASLEAFFSDARKRIEWKRDALQEDRDVLPPETLSDIGAFLALQGKAEDFFARVRAVGFDERALPSMNGEETAFVAIGADVIDAQASKFEGFPLAHVAKGATLPLGLGVNPAWSDRVAAFRDKVVKPLLGTKLSLTEADFRELQRRLAPQLAWQAKKPESLWSSVSEADLQQFMEAKAEERLTELIAADEAATEEANAIESVEKLVRFKRDLLPLANNFVAFRDFYQPGKEAVFQVGTLYVDHRSLDLVLRVADAARHAALAPHSAMYLLYCDAKNGKGEKRAIVAAVTDGDVDNLAVGRNALFYDRRGGDWDAIVTKIVENPISLRQAFWTPYKKFLRLIEDQISKRAAAAEAEADARVGQGAASVDSASKGAVAAAPPPPKKLDIGVVAALGVAVGGITAALGIFLQAFVGLGIWMPLGVVGLMLLISLPSVAVAWLKLRRRNLGPLLDANGWAINVLPRVNVPLGRSLTSLARLPSGARRNLSDPFAAKKAPWWRLWLLFLLVALGLPWYLGKLDAYLPKKVQSITVLGDAAPSKVQVQPAPTATPPSTAAPASPVAPAP